MPRRDDVAALTEYALSPGGLDGGWLPILAATSPDRLERIVEDWLSGWRGRPSHNAPALLLDLEGVSVFVGHVGVGTRAPGVVELTYGIAPAWRRQGLATRAAILATNWLVRDRGVRVVELRIGAEHAASRRVAERAGFRLAGPAVQHLPGPGGVHKDVRYVFEAGAG
jgi:RimJ/RimL family protein N-acetyltransferase